MSQQRSSGARSVERSFCSRPQVSNESILQSICTAVDDNIFSCVQSAAFPIVSPMQVLQCWVVTCSASQPCAGGTSSYKDLCKRARPADPAAPVFIDSQHVSSPTPVPASLISHGRSSQSSSTSGVCLPGIETAHGSETFAVLPGVHAQRHCPKHRVELGHWLCSCYRSCALRGLYMRAWGFQSGRKSRAPQAGCPNLQGVAGEAAAAPPPRVQPTTRTSSSHAASAAAVIPSATAQLGRPGVVTACEYRLAHRSIRTADWCCFSCMTPKSSDAMGGEACCSTFPGSPATRQPNCGISSCSPSCRQQADLVVCFLHRQHIWQLVASRPLSIQ